MASICLRTGTPVVSDISFDIAPGEILGVVGESGSGKTTVGLAMLGHARRGLRIAAGSVMLGGRDIVTLDQSALRRPRGSVGSNEWCSATRMPITAARPGDWARPSTAIQPSERPPSLRASSGPTGILTS